MPASALLTCHTTLGSGWTKPFLVLLHPAALLNLVWLLHRHPCPTSLLALKPLPQLQQQALPPCPMVPLCRLVPLQVKASLAILLHRCNRKMRYRSIMTCAHSGQHVQKADTSREASLDLSTFEVPCYVTKSSQASAHANSPPPPPPPQHALVVKHLGIDPWQTASQSGWTGVTHDKLTTITTQSHHMSTTRHLQTALVTAAGSISSTILCDWTTYDWSHVSSLTLVVRLTWTDQGLPFNGFPLAVACKRWKPGCMSVKLKLACPSANPSIRRLCLSARHSSTISRPSRSATFAAVHLQTV